MVIRKSNNHLRRAALTTELVVGLAILSIGIVPLSYSFIQENKVLGASYQRAIAMEIVDGEMEILRAGEWKRFGDGRHTYPITAGAATNLPSKRFVLTKTGKKLRLEWYATETATRPQLVREGEIE